MQLPPRGAAPPTPGATSSGPRARCVLPCLPRRLLQPLPAFSLSSSFVTLRLLKDMDRLFYRLSLTLHWSDVCSRFHPEFLKNPRIAVQRPGPFPGWAGPGCCGEGTSVSLSLSVLQRDWLPLDHCASWGGVSNRVRPPQRLPWTGRRQGCCPHKTCGDRRAPVGFRVFTAAFPERAMPSLPVTLWAVSSCPRGRGPP